MYFSDDFSHPIPLGNLIMVMAVVVMQTSKILRDRNPLWPEELWYQRMGENPCFFFSISVSLPLGFEADTVATWFHMAERESESPSFPSRKLGMEGS